MPLRQTRAEFSRSRTLLWILPLALLAGCSARTPGRVETWFVQETKHHVTVGGSKDLNPFPPTLGNIHDGQKAFSAYCFVCHGLDGQNTGVPFADRMSPPVPPLNSGWVQRYNDGQLHHIISEGVSPSGMPASNGILSDDDIWKIVLYVRNLPPKGSLGEPKVYSGP